jgi:hypothetical protein
MRTRRLVFSAKVVVALLLAAASSAVLRAQPLTTPVSVAPDCLIFYDFSANASSASFDNRFIGCKTWYVAYTSTGFPALTLTFESAPDNSGVPGAWVAFAGTLVEGVNPNVALTQASSIFYGYYPWQRITLSGAVAGAGRRIRGTFYGYRQQPVASVIMAPGGVVLANQGAPAVQANRWPVFLSDGAAAQGLVANPLFTRLSDGAAAVGTTANPLATGLEYFLGATSTWTPAPACNARAAITIAGAGTTEIIAASGALSTRICHLSLSLTGATNVTLVQGTGANCAVAPANITGAYQNVLGLALDLGDRSLVTAAASQAVCITNSAAVNGGGFVVYSTY